jgi:hypothetical protein
VDHTHPQQEAERLGSLVAVLYEEGLLTKLHLEPHRVAVSLSKESPLQVLGAALQLRDTLPVAERLARIVTTDWSPAPLTDEGLLAFYHSYDGAQTFNRTLSEWLAGLA